LCQPNELWQAIRQRLNGQQLNEKREEGSTQTKQTMKNTITELLSIFNPSRKTTCE
jgi:hypothetical protein